MTMTTPRAPILAIASQHVEESAHLRNVRTVLVRAPHVRLLQLGRLDERIAAHLDGVAVSGDRGARLSAQALASPNAGGVFTLAVQALERRDAGALDRMMAVVEAAPELRRGVASALGWVSAQLLAGQTGALLASQATLPRRLGLAACAMHRVDPGAALANCLRAPDAGLRVMALRVAALAGRVDLLDGVLAAGRVGGAVSAMTPGAADELRAWSAWSAVLMGERGAPLSALQALVTSDVPLADTMLLPALLASDLGAAHQLLRALAKAGETSPRLKRRLIRACGIVGDTYFMPWLIGLCGDDRWARLAGEAISLMTGLDLARLDLERKPPEGSGDGKFGGPTEDPADDNVAMDEDDSLPWPDAAKLQDWWAGNSARLAPGQRWFMGEAPSAEVCARVLREGYQRQRWVAALWAPVLQPGTKVFPIAAPAWRQRRWLGLDRV
jgi:uncharacterized protein (TIGR02270 family)